MYFCAAIKNKTTAAELAMFLFIFIFIFFFVASKAEKYGINTGAKMESPCEKWWENWGGSWVAGKLGNWETVRSITEQQSAPGTSAKVQ